MAEGRRGATGAHRPIAHQVAVVEQEQVQGQGQIDEEAVVGGGQVDDLEAASAAAQAARRTRRGPKIPTGTTSSSTSTARLSKWCHQAGRWCAYQASQVGSGAVS